MTFLSILKEIFLQKDSSNTAKLLSKNLTQHYVKELGHLYFHEVCVAGEYALLEKKIERYKYHSDRHISTELVDILSKCVEVSNYYQTFDDWIIVPIPMHWTRYLLRGFNHTQRMAKQFSFKQGCTSISLLGTHWTRRQSKLSRVSRMKNKKNSFFLKNRYTIPSHIILIDDVVSSGSTLNEAAKVLVQGGAECVICFAIASNA